MFPCFGAPTHPEHLKLSQHGFARNSVWAWDGTVMDNDAGVSVRLSQSSHPNIASQTQTHCVVTRQPCRRHQRSRPFIPKHSTSHILSRWQSISLALTYTSKTKDQTLLHSRHCSIPTFGLLQPPSSSVLCKTIRTSTRQSRPKRAEHQSKLSSALKSTSRNTQTRSTRTLQERTMCSGLKAISRSGPLI